MKRWLKNVLILLFLFDICCSIYYYHATETFIEDHAPQNLSPTIGIVFHNDYPIENSESLRRASVALSLYNQGILDRIICSGSLPDEEPSGAYLMKQYLIQNGVPEEKILVDSLSSDSYSNIKHTLELIDTSRYTQILLFSDPFHLPRLYILMKHQGIKSTVASYSLDKLSLWDSWLRIQREMIARIGMFLLGDVLFSDITVSMRE